MAYPDMRNPMTPDMMNPGHEMSPQEMEMKKKETIDLIQYTVDCLVEASDWEDVAFVKALSIGLQGEKRVNRFEGTGDNNIRKYLQSEAFDIFEHEIHVHHEDVHFPRVTTPEEFFDAYRKKLWEMYYILHGAANKFVAPLCMKCLSDCLYQRAHCLKKDIVRVNRTIARLRQKGQYHDLMIYETTWENVHDEYEEKEHEHGYKH